jgi:hypothetical protein
VDLYIDSRIRLHGVVLNSLSTGTILPFTQIKFYKVIAFSVLVCRRENWDLNRFERRETETEQVRFLRPVA